MGRAVVGWYKWQRSSLHWCRRWSIVGLRSWLYRWPIVG